MLKHSARMMLGRALKMAGLTEFVREAYFLYGERFLRGLGELQGAWYRRSIATKDFVPVISDIDLTLLLNRTQIERLYWSRQLSLRPSLLQDIQLVYEPFFFRWERTGGIRNRQIANWVPAGTSVSLKSPGENSKSILAFELAHELYLLYKQLVPRLGKSHRDESAKKLFFEINRLIHFWNTGDEQCLKDPRQKFSFDLNHHESKFFMDFNQFCQELLNHVDPVLAQVQPETLLLESGTDWIRLNYKMENRFVTIVSPEGLTRMGQRFQNDFVTTNAFVALILGAGIQAQPLLNELAWKENGYYRDYCTQRLAHDLIGSILLNPQNARQLYFCFKNIHEFLAGFKGLGAPGWLEVSTWTESKPFPLGDEAILEKTFRNLELLESIR